MITSCQFVVRWIGRIFYIKGVLLARYMCSQKQKKHKKLKGLGCFGWVNCCTYEVGKGECIIVLFYGLGYHWYARLCMWSHAYEMYKKEEDASWWNKVFIGWGIFLVRECLLDKIRHKLSCVCMDIHIDQFKYCYQGSVWFVAMCHRKNEGVGKLWFMHVSLTSSVLLGFNTIVTWSNNYRGDRVVVLGGLGGS